MTGVSREDAWSQYWESGVLHSCSTSLDDQYSGAIGDFWHQTASEIPDGAALLDVATGNGPVPKFLASCANASTWVIRGIDLAEIHPDWLNDVPHVDVQLSGNCGLEEVQSRLRIGSEPAEFDLLTSQFGWEYITPLDEAIEQAFRLTKPKGKWRFVCHHAEGVLVQVAREEVAHVDFLLSEGGLLKCTASLLPWMERARLDPGMVRDNPQASASRTAFNDAMTLIGERIQTSMAPDLLNEFRDGVHSLVLQVADGMKINHPIVLSQWRLGLRASRHRCQELIDHALSKQMIEQLEEMLNARDPKAVIDAIELHQQEGLLGWGIRVNWGN